MNKILDQLDSFFASQKESEQKLFFFLPILLFGFLSYYFLYPITDQDLTNTTNKNKSLKIKIANVKSSNMRLHNENMKLIAILKIADKKLSELRKNKNEVDKLVKQLSFLQFNLTKWANFYNHIPNMAKKYHLVIQNLQNSMLLNNNKQLINKKMSLVIELNGDFSNFIKFMNKFETKKELIKIKYIYIDGFKMIMKVDIYGAKI